MADVDLIESALRVLLENGEIAKSDWPENALPHSGLDLLENHTHLKWRNKPDTLELKTLQAAFPDVTIELFQAIGSTNTYLLDTPSVTEDRLCLAEMQIAGRGRRGRHWVSPYARNLAISFGYHSLRPLAELGGLSSVVGLALAAEFQSYGIEQAGIKWPNDIWVDGAKLAGILVELKTNSRGAYVVIGMGVNVSLNVADNTLIDQQATDLRHYGVDTDRSGLVIAIVRRLRAFLGQFERSGFADFVAAFNEAHLFHGQVCRVIQGAKEIEGVVLGIGIDGALILQTSDGEQHFHGGEVSLRPSSVI